MRPILFLLLILPFIYCQQNQRYVTVTTSKGTVQGAKIDYGSDMNNLYYGSADCFLGIPYAQPPVGQLRFAEPVPPPPSSRVYDATYLRGRCPQSGSTPGPVSEDCLYLNIFAQNVGNSSQLNAVMVFIGGEDGLNKGGADGAQIPGIIRNLVTRGVVVVTIQYRLGALGFMNIAGSGIPQNLGMLDQVQALQWIQSEIKSFGGDPNRITLCGQADGACAVAAHAVSPLSNGLFQQAILQSGTIYTCYQDTAQSPQSFPYSSQTTTIPTLQYDPGLQYQPIGGYHNINQQSNGGYYNNNNQQPYPSNGGYNNNQQQPMYQPPNQQQINNRPPTVYDEDPSMQIAMQLCNVTMTDIQQGNTNRLRSCLLSLTVDVFIQMQGQRVSKWVIVRDNSFLPDSPDRLAQINPRRIPMIIGTVQDEDADYVFKMMADGSARGKNEQQLFDGWFIDFAKKNKLSGQEAQQCKNIISNNYNVTQQPVYNGQNPQYSNQNQPNYNNNYQNGPMYNSNNNYNNNGNNNNFMSQNGNVPSNQAIYSNTQYNQFNGGNNGNMPASSDMVQNLQVISRIASDANGISESVNQVNIVQRSGSNTRVFQFTHVTNLGRTPDQTIGNWKPVYRGQDMIFLFMSETIWKGSNPTQEDIRVANDMGTKWTDFVKTGQVQGWQPTPQGQFNYCNLNSNSQMQSNYGSQARQVFNDQVYPIVQRANNPQSMNTNQYDNANVMVHNTNGNSSWSISFSLPASFLVPMN